MMQLYDPSKAAARLGIGSGAVGEEVYFIENPGLGLWASAKPDSKRRPFRAEKRSPRNEKIEGFKVSCRI